MGGKRENIARKPPIECHFLLARLVDIPIHDDFSLVKSLLRYCPACGKCNDNLASIIQLSAAESSRGRESCPYETPSNLAAICNSNISRA